ncbi:MAG: 1,4-dihydroxy-2-naphthoate polyprenyltransferase [Bacteroidetes bacterium]|nr:1,4-dihydroxy-2-naphthoate polyprenyltransferase [Bacteroidota bacterium]
MDLNSKSKINIWITAARPKTLLAAVVPVLVGSSVAFQQKMFKPQLAIVALICSLLIQIGTNFVNDLFDFIKGADNKNRVGPKRIMLEGLVTINEMKLAIKIVFGVCFLLGLFLVYSSGWIILLIGIISIIAGIIYTAGPLPLAYNGLGDVAVFIFFGFVATVGSYYLQTLQINYFIFLCSVPVGALITNILVVNNYRDREQDKSVGKKTLAVILGDKLTRLEYILLFVMAYFVPIILFLFYKINATILLPLATIPLAIKLILMIYRLRGSDLNATLEQTAKLSAIYGLLFVVGLLI